jgi:hypothetical protein
MLQKYSARTLPIMLKESAQHYMERNMSVNDDYHLIMLPKLVQWFRRDFME